MPRLRYIEESEKSAQARALIESAKRTGAPDPRVVSIMARSQLGTAWVSIGTSFSIRACCRTSSRRCAHHRYRSRINADTARWSALMSRKRRG